MPKKNAITKVKMTSNEDAKRRITRKKMFEYATTGANFMSLNSQLYDLGEYLKDDSNTTYCCCCRVINTELIRLDQVVKVTFSHGNFIGNCCRFGPCTACCNMACPQVCQLPMTVEWQLEGGFRATSVIKEGDVDRFELFFYEKYKEQMRLKRAIAQGMA